jgi:hypothetical protein
MIRAGLVVLLALGASSTTATAQEQAGQALCAEVWTRLTTIAAPVLQVAGQIAPDTSDGCLFTDLRIETPGQYVPDWHIDALHLAGSSQWIADGTTPPERLTIGVSDLRMVIQTGNPQMDYLLAAQAKPSAIQIEAELSWDAAARNLVLDRLEVDFPGENLITLSARLAGVDLSSAGAMQMSATSFAVTEADLMIQAHGLFEWYALMAWGPLFLPLDGDMEAAMARNKSDLVAGIATLPGATFAKPSRDALAALVGELPNPSGILTLSMRTDAGVGPARLMGYAMTGVPDSLAEAGLLFDGVRIDIGWTHEDAR